MSNSRNYSNYTNLELYALFNLEQNNMVLLKEVAERFVVQVQQMTFIEDAWKDGFDEGFERGYGEGVLDHM